MSDKNPLSTSSINRLTLGSLQWRFSWLIILLIAALTNAVFIFAPGQTDTQAHLFDRLQFYCNALLALVFTYAVFLKSQQISHYKVPKTYWLIILPVALLLRLLMTQLGGNYDLESFEITGDIVLNGNSVYGATTRYNYGPLWAYWLGLLKFLASVGGGYNRTLFHSYIVVTLYLAELQLIKGIKKHGYSDFCSLILLFNPVSIILIGHHSQFDIIAIAVGYFAYHKIVKGKMLSGLVLLGLSYSIKHILVFLPLLMVFDTRISRKNRLLTLLVPALIFAISFLPFVGDWQAIQKNVLSYQLNHGQTLFYKLFEIVIPHAFSEFGSLNTLPLMNGYKPLWIASFVLLGYAIKTCNTGHYFELYLCYLVGSSLAISEQYFLIPLMAIVLYRKYFVSWLYLLLSSYYIMFVSAHNTAKYFNLDNLGMHLPADWYSLGFAQVQLCLILLCVLVLARKIIK
jgi:hypothetical protein